MPFLGGSPTLSRYVDDISRWSSNASPISRRLPALLRDRDAGGAVASARVAPPLDRYGSDVLADDWRTPEERPRRRDRRRPRAGRRGGHHRLVRRDRQGRARPRHAHPGGPPQQAAHLPARSGLPARGPAGRPRRPDPQGPRGADAYGVRVGRRPGRQGPRRPGQPDLRRGPARRRARREGLGRRPPDRGRGRGVPRRRRRPRREAARLRPGPERRVGVLVDHLVPGSKESRIAAVGRASHRSASTC